LQQQEFKTEVQPLADKKLNLYSATLLNSQILSMQHHWTPLSYSRPCYCF
jgi:hypothetical protein